MTGTVILLARHGETDWNRDGRFQGHADPPLNELGRSQASALAERLDGDGLTVLYTSDLQRAVETAEIIGARLGLSARPHSGLREIDVGAWSGLTRAELTQRFPESYRVWSEGGEPPEWEARARFVARVGEAVLEIATRHPGSRVVAVGHGGTIRAAERYAGLEPSWPIENCAVAEFAATGGTLDRVDGHVRRRS